MTNTLYYGDNLEILRKEFPADAVDLIYLDPPFNSNANYNVLFKSPGGDFARAQRDVFEDTWQWDRSASLAFHEVVTRGEPASKILDALRSFLGENDLLAYLSMMTIRLIELERVLKSTGSIYLHCDPTASHYLKLIMDAVFDKKNFHNEIIWHYRKWPTGKYVFQRNHDVILFYSKSTSIERIFNQLYMGRAASTLKRFGTKKIISGYTDGRRNPAQMAEEESGGVRMDDVWDIGRVPPIKQIFPTQKPDTLLKRIIEASSAKGQIVLDPFCGCGTAIVTADSLDRQWYGIDVAYEAMMIIEARLNSLRPTIKRGQDYILSGTPRDMVAARALAKDDPYGFQSWAVSLLRGGQPHGRKEIKKGKDRGIDGLIYYYAGAQDTGFVIISVKGGGNISSQMIRDLRGTMHREGAKLGIFLTLTPPTRDMRAESAAADFIELGGSSYPGVQIITVEELLDGKRPELPPVYDLATLLNMPKALPIMKKADPEVMRKQINMMLPLRGGRTEARPELFDNLQDEEEVTVHPTRKSRRRGS